MGEMLGNDLHNLHKLHVEGVRVGVVRSVGKREHKENKWLRGLS